MLATRPHGPAAALTKAVGGTERWLELDVRVPRSMELSVNLTKGKAFTLINYRRPGAPGPPLRRCPPLRLCYPLAIRRHDTILDFKGELAGPVEPGEQGKGAILGLHRARQSAIKPPRIDQ